MLLAIGLGPRFHVFFFVLGLPIVHFAFLSVAFYLDFCHFFFLLLFPSRVLLLYLFIKETMNKIREMMNNMRTIKKTMNNRRLAKKNEQQIRR